IAFRRPRPKASPCHEMGPTIEPRNGTHRQIPNGPLICALTPSWAEPFLMQDPVHVIRGDPPGPALGLRPQGRKDECFSPPAFEAWPVPRRERRGLIQKEQLGIPPRRHHLPMPAAELQLTADPLPCYPAAASESLFRPVETAAPFSHHGPARRRRDDLSLGRHAGLERHVRSQRST